MEQKGSCPQIGDYSNYPQNDPELFHPVLPGIIHRLCRVVDKWFLPVSKFVCKGRAIRFGDNFPRRGEIVDSIVDMQLLFL